MDNVYIFGNREIGEPVNILLNHKRVFRLNRQRHMFGTEPGKLVGHWPASRGHNRPPPSVHNGTRDVYCTTLHPTGHEFRQNLEDRRGSDTIYH